MSAEADSKSQANASPAKSVGARAAPPGTPLAGLSAAPAPKGTPASVTMKRAAHAQGWTAELAVDLALWFTDVLPNSSMKDVVTAEDFFDRLQTGVELCDLLNKIAPDYAVSTIARDAKPQSYQAYDNIQSFLDAAKKIGVHDLSRFVVDDLIQRKSDKLVVNTLLQLADLAAIKNKEAPRLTIRDEVRQAFASPQKKANASAADKGTAVGAGTAAGSAVHGSSSEQKPTDSASTAVGAGVASSYAAYGQQSAADDTNAAATGAGKRNGSVTFSEAQVATGADDEEDDDDEEDGDDAAAAGGSGSGAGSAQSEEARAARRARREARRAAHAARKCHGGGSGEKRRGRGCGKCCKKSDTANPDKMFFGLLLFATHAAAYYLKRRSGK